MSAIAWPEATCSPRAPRASRVSSAPSRRSTCRAAAGRGRAVRPPRFSSRGSCRRPDMTTSGDAVLVQVADRRVAEEREHRVGASPCERAPKRLVGVEARRRAVSRASGRRLGGSCRSRSARRDRRGRRAAAAPLPWSSASGVPSPSRSATAGDASIPSATTGKQVGDGIAMGQSAGTPTRRVRAAAVDDVVEAGARRPRRPLVRPGDDVGDAVAVEVGDGGRRS